MNPLQNPKHPHIGSMGIAAITLDSILLSLAATALVIRIASRNIQGLRLCLNDYAALLAWLFSAGLVSSAVFAIIEDGGQHIQYVNPENLADILKAYVGANVLWAAANTAVKVSIVHFYLTIFGSNRSFRHITYAVIAFITAFGIAIILSAFLTCRPFAKNWNETLPGTCGSISGLIIAISVINMAVDLAIITLPMPMVWRLQMATSRKLALTFTFGLGLLVCGLTMLRLAMAILVDIDDFTYTLGRLGTVTDLEPLLGITIACLPVFPPVLRRIWFGKDTKNSRTHTSSSSMDRLRYRNTWNSTFRKVDDSYPLTDVEGLRTQNQITGPNSKFGSMSEDRSVGEEGYGHAAIKVKQGWEVRYDKAG